MHPCIIYPRLTSVNNKDNYNLFRKCQCVLLALWYIELKKTTNINYRRKRRWWVRPINQKRNHQGDGDHLIHEMRLYDVEVHFQYTRLTVEGFDNLLRIVQPHIEKMPTNYRKPIPARSRLYLTLRFLATGDTMSSIAFAYQVGQNTACKIISETCESLWNVLQNELFQPSESEWKKVVKEFENDWNFPHCIGALDGKHVNVKAPPHSGSTFYNYKGNHSISLMAIASARYKFLMVDIDGEGRHSDGGIFKNSVMGYRFQHNQMYIPSPTPIIEGGEPMSYMLIADEAFQLNNYALRPYPGKTLTNEQAIFNYRLSRARRVIENTFGIMVAQWTILAKKITTSLKTAESIVKACVILHNYCMDKVGYCSKGFADEPRRNKEPTSGEWRTVIQNNCGLASLQNDGSNTHSRQANAIRENFKNYFLNEGAVSWQWDFCHRW
ncbi:PREDICTED: putative nuclease HARBI1 [Cyphomyrmex costatus]|uniref:putative nuclease HARBI1 n=1 Tax=Cyphomyrmex costatus TaxID=456900 RepID=UPI0008523553|nr:PREDICTED: putative nuclease HARBI1 [Cyphomyrmex costatus]